MTELKREVKTYIVEFECEECKEGTLVPTGEAYMTYPAQYPHRCTNDKCNEKKTFNYRYPKTVLE